MPPGTTINSARYCGTLSRLRKAIKSKRPGLLSEQVILLHDNARPHTSHATATHLNKFRWEVLQHPAYSPDLSPCDFHIFGPLKKELKGHRFQSDDEVKERVRDFFMQQPKSFYEKGIESLTQRWDLCLNNHGDYF
jgi:hypothetical protein